MKKPFRICAAASIGLGMLFAVSTNGFANPEAGIADFIDDFCEPKVEAGTYETIGECMGKNRQEVVDYCKDNYQAMRHRNHGSCEKWAQEVIKNKNY